MVDKLSGSGLVAVSAVMLHLLLAAWATPASAQGASEDPAARMLATEQAGGAFSETLTGAWGGARSDLRDGGVDLYANFQTESAWNPVGGKREAIAYTQQLEFGANLDLEKMAGFSGTAFHARMSHRAGRSLAADALGSMFPVQQLYGAGQTLRLSELNLTQSLLDDRLWLRVGWAPLGNDFATTPIACPFQNNMVCGHASALTQNSGARNSPVGQWGAQARFMISPILSVATGIFRFNPDAGNRDDGLDLGFKGTGAFVPVEMVWSPRDAATGLPSTALKIGAYYNSAKTPDVYFDGNHGSAGLTGQPFHQHDGRWGAYAQITQRIFREQANPARGMTLFGLGGIGDAATARFRHMIAVGGRYMGTFSGRDADYVSLIVGRSEINPRLSRYQRDRDLVMPGAIDVQTSETLVEMDYHAQVTPWLFLRPNLQYVIRPGGAGKIPDALVAGLSTRIDF